jgi:DNA topoisomerase-1
LERNYVFKRGNALVPTWTAMAVVNLMEQHLPDLVDYQFTARLEDDLDSISRGEAGHVDYLRTFYYGKDREGLKHQVEDKLASIDIREICQFRIDRPGELEQGAEPIYVRVGRYGPFLEQGERRASIPDDAAPDEVTVAKAQEWLQRSAQGEAPLGICPETNRPVFLKSGRFGPYVQRGTADDPDPPQNASLLKGMAPQDVTLEVALRLLSLPRELGKHPDTGETVIAANGRFGPYVKCGNETRSLPDETSPLDLTLAQALELLRQPKASRRRFAAPREPLKTFSVSPVTHQPVRLLDGRYGPYVTDGQTNASLPKGTSPEELSFEQALELLAARAAQGPPKRGGRGFRTRRAAAGSSQSNGGAKKPRATRKKSTGKRAAE